MPLSSDVPDPIRFAGRRRVVSQPGQRTKVIAALTTMDANGAYIYTDKGLNRADVNRTETRFSTSTPVITELSK